MMDVYMDNCATTPVAKEAVKEMEPYYNRKFGNPSSLHYQGVEADKALQDYRERLAKLINADTEEIYFTSGGTEGDNIAIFGTTHGKKGVLVTSSIEHAAVQKPFERLEKEGFKVIWLPVDNEGFIDMKSLEKALEKKPLIVSIIHGNHEIGTIQDIGKIGEMCREKDVLFHTDACQSFTKTELDVKKQKLDMVTLNGHKIHGPKGVGALYIRKEVKEQLTKLTEGGPHEMSMRPGTENVSGIAGFVKAAELGMKDYDKNSKYMRKLQKKLIKGLLEIPETFLNGPKDMEKRLPNNVDIGFRYIEGEAVLMRLSFEGVCVSTGSACSSKSLQASPILTAIGLKHEEAHGCMRFSLSRFNTEEEVDYVIGKTREVVKGLRDITSFVPGKTKSYEEIKREGK